MDLAVLTYLLYLALAVPLTIWVGRALSRHGGAFLVDVFYGDDRLANAVNQLLVIGFYLLNLGYLSYFMATSGDVENAREVMEALATKVGGVALVVGAIHFANLWCLNAFRRRALLRAQARPPVDASHYTTVAPPPPPPPIEPHVVAPPV
jgi:hypothetical protein